MSDEVPAQGPPGHDPEWSLIHELRNHQLEIEKKNEELNRAREELEISRKKYCDLYDQAPVGYFTVSATGIILEANLTAASLLGIERESLINHPLSRFILPEDHPIYYQHRKHILETGALQMCEMRMMRKDSSPFLALLEATLTQGTSGAPLCRVAMSDITELQQKEEALKASEERFFALFDLAPLGYQSLDADGRFIDVNRAWLETFGYGREEVIGRWFGDFLAPEFVDIFRERFPLFKANGRIHSEFQMLRKDGNRVFIAFDGRIGYETDGSFKQTHCILSDITERKQTEKTLKRNEARYRSVVEDQTELICRYRKDGKLSFVNEAYAKYYGKYRDEIIDTNFIPHIPEPDLSMIKEKLAGITQENPVATFEHHIVLPNDEVRWQSWTHRGIYSANGKFLETQAVGRDITERKKTEEELRNAREALQMANRELEQALEREQQLSRTDAITGIDNRRSFAERAAHLFDVGMRYHHPLAVILFDIDDFKEVNDTFGHAAGDHILQHVTEVACAELRSSDVIGRYGGDEFVIALPVTTAIQALPVAERIRRGVEALSVRTFKKDVSVTLSIGISETVQSPPDDSVERVIIRADEAMYAAKQAGKNRIERMEGEAAKPIPL